MAKKRTTSLDILIGGKFKGQRAFKQAEAGLKNIRTVAFAAKAAIVAAVAKIASEIGSAPVKAFAEQEKAEVRLQRALANRGKLSEKSIEALKAQASALQETSAVGDEAALSMQATAIAMGATIQKAGQLPQAAANLASALGKDVDTAAQQLNKTLGGFAGELGEVLPEIKALTKEQLQAGAAIDLVNKKFAGFAEAQAETTGGALAQIKNLFGDLLEVIGESMAPAIDFIRDKFKEAFPTIKRAVQSAMKIIGGTFRGVFDAIRGILKSFGVDIGDTGDFLRNMVDLAIDGMKLLSEAFIGAFTFIEVALTHWRDAINLAFKQVKLKAITLKEDIKHELTQIGRAFLGLETIDVRLLTPREQELRAEAAKLAEGMSDAFKSKFKERTKFLDDLGEKTKLFFENANFGGQNIGQQLASAVKKIARLPATQDTRFLTGANRQADPLARAQRERTRIQKDQLKETKKIPEEIRALGQLLRELSAQRRTTVGTL